ncbi:MAG: Npt1/Npt2 family nucleotide transporter [Anaerolineae bacterium]
MIKKLLWPIKRDEWVVFALMFGIVCMINANFSILRSARNALVIADKGGSAAYIPYFELFGTFPASILMTWALSRLMRIFSLRFIFSATMLFFFSFFIIFAFWIYPQREQIHAMLETKLGLLFGLTRFKVVFTHWPDMIFYIISELWKVALLSVLFWGFINQNLSLEKATRFYPPLMLGSSIGAIIAGPITVFCTSQFSWDYFAIAAQRWQHSLYLLTLFLVVCGCFTLVAFNWLFKKLQIPTSVSLKTDAKKEPFSRRLLSLSSSLKYLLKSPYLCALAMIVIAEYVSYALGELIFLDKLKEVFPTPTAYCRYMGSLTLWTGILTAFSALVLTPYLLQNYRWSRSALITPISMVIMTFAFFSVICFGKAGWLQATSPFNAAVVLGSVHFCMCRSAKYTLFDATKELAFIPLEQEAQVKGKLIIDGIGSRLGRGTSSFLSIFLFLILGGPGESALFAGILALSFALISIRATRFIGREFDQMTPPVSSEKKIAIS